MSQHFRNEEQENANIEEDLIYQNIRRSRLHKEETRFYLFPCVEVISWLIPNIYITTHIIKDFSGKGITSFHSTQLEKSCQVIAAKVFMTLEWVAGLKLNYVDFIKKVWLVGKNFFPKGEWDYETKLLKPPYQIVAYLLCRLYNMEKPSHFKLQWTPVLYYVIVHATRFKWEFTIFVIMEDVVKMEQTIILANKYQFHMSSYFLGLCMYSPCFPRNGVVVEPQ